MAPWSSACRWWPSAFRPAWCGAFPSLWPGALWRWVPSTSCSRPPSGGGASRIWNCWWKPSSPLAWPSSPWRFPSPWKANGPPRRGPWKARPWCGSGSARAANWLRQPACCSNWVRESPSWTGEACPRRGAACPSPTAIASGPRSSPWPACSLAGLSMPAATLAFLVASAALAARAHVRLAWDGLALAALLGLPGMAFSLLLTALDGGSPARHGGWWAWPLAIALHFGALRSIEGAQAPRRLLPAWHGLGLWVFACALGWDLSERLEAVPGSGWHLAMPTLAACLAVGGAAALGRRPIWPVGPWQRAYLSLGAGGIALFLLAWSVAVNGLGDGSAAPLQ